MVCCIAIVFETGPPSHHENVACTVVLVGKVYVNITPYLNVMLVSLLLKTKSVVFYEHECIILPSMVQCDPKQTVLFQFVR